MSQPPIPPSLTQFQIDKSVVRQVRQWINTTATWTELPSSSGIPDTGPALPPQPWHKNLQPEITLPERRVAICMSADVEAQKAVLWEQMAPIAIEQFDFVSRRLDVMLETNKRKVPYYYKLVRSPNRKFIFQTRGTPFLVLPIEFEKLKDAIQIGYKQIGLIEGRGVYTNEAVELSGSVIFYYMRPDVADRDGHSGQRTT